MSSMSTPKSSTCKTANSGSSCSPKKIPRPPNSFLIYRKEHAKAYKGLVATELSSKLAEAWNNETPECRAHYARLADKAKKEHAIKYPNYKFTPIKRGTGKRALALAAMANAAKKANEAAVAAATAAAVTAVQSTITTPTTTNNIMGADSADADNCRRRSMQKAQRFPTTAPYPYISTAKHGPVVITSPADPAALDVNSPSLFFNPYSLTQWTHPQTVPSQAQNTVCSPTSPTMSTSSASSASDVDELEEDGSSRPFSQAFEQLMGQDFDHTSAISRWMPTLSSFQDDSLVFGVPPCPSLLSLESFEPECLAREDAQWTTTSESICPMLSSSPTSSSVSSSPETSSYGYLAPTYENCSPMFFGMDMPATPVTMPATPLFTPVIVPSQVQIQPLSKDTMMSPMVFTNAKTLPNANADYFLNWL